MIGYLGWQLGILDFGLHGADGGFRTEKTSIEGDDKAVQEGVVLKVELNFIGEVRLEPQLGRTFGLY